MEAAGELAPPSMFGKLAILKRFEGSPCLLVFWRWLGWGWPHERRSSAALRRTLPIIGPVTPTTKLTCLPDNF
jgi:hypothetical protein